MEEHNVELRAMAAVAEALETLTSDARQRVLSWAVDRYQARVSLGSKEEPTSGFRDFADLFDATTPDTEVDKALVAAYWFQVEQGDDEWGAQTLHNGLKDLGQGITNITRALTRGQEARPALVRQLQ